jgi:hypothetical protein
MKAMPRKKNKLGITSVAQSLLMGAGSVLSFFGGDYAVGSNIPMARQDRDYKSLQSDWQRVGDGIRSSMKKERQSQSISKKK